MSDNNKQNAPQVEDIDAPIELKQSKIAQGLSRVGVSKKGLGITALTGAALVGLIGFGVMSAGPGGAGGGKEKGSGSTDMPGLSQAFSVDRAIAEAAAKKQEELRDEAPAPDPQRLQVRGGGQAQAVAAGPSGQQTPAEQHRAWLEKKKYERAQGRIIAGDAALTSDMLKGGAGSNGMRRVAAAGDADGGDPLARLQAARQKALDDSARMAEQTPSLPPSTLAGLGALAGAGTGASADPAVAAQDRNRSFLSEAAAAAAAGYLPERVRYRVGEHELSAGSIIPAVMLTGINSDLPGVITAQVRQTVYDTFDEHTVVIPQGSRMVGRYSSQVAVGQNRVLVAWDELIMPNGSRINLAGMTGADGIGQGGFGDKVDNHFWKLWGNALMVSMLGVGVQLSQPQNSSYNTTPTTAQQATGAAAASLNQAGSKVLERNLNISPTLTIRPGYAFNVVVNKSIIFPAYREN